MVIRSFREGGISGIQIGRLVVRGIPDVRFETHPTSEPGTRRLILVTEVGEMIYLHICIAMIPK